MSTYLYIAAAVLFILGIKRLGKVKTARSGNQVAALGMLVALIGVLVEAKVLDWTMASIALGIGTVIGVLLATRVQMTSMPGMTNHAPMKMSGLTTKVGADGKTLVITTKAPMPAGGYTLDWHAVAADTHRVEGSFSFTVK